ncbi:BspA family leucine-rich repeat surface protein [Enterococcus faecalis]|uniref:BspA family leucine-rich repeat surface protein n=1 Tax=Enterococcus faecalis TaxID=1351 RepID=UPI0025B1B3C3|nr:BspA family leucine-rich repeat surface protein [Enterococcus faecalis]MDN3185246.1 BspA family leucine-rich repeat surface protein [Enterococcus faecalis]
MGSKKEKANRMNKDSIKKMVRGVPFVLAAMTLSIGIETVSTKKVIAQEQTSISDEAELSQQIQEGKKEVERKKTEKQKKTSGSSTHASDVREGKVTKDVESVKEELLNEMNQIAIDDLLQSVGGRKELSHVLTAKYHVELPSDKDSIDSYQLDESYEALKTNSEAFLAKLLTRYPDSEEEIKNNLMAILLVKTYINKWYDINVGETNVSEEVFNSLPNVEAIISIAESFKKKPDYLSSNLTGQTYREVLSPYFSSTNVGELIESYIQKYVGTTDYVQWFSNYFDGLIIEPSTTEKQYPMLYKNIWENVKYNANSKSLKSKGGDNYFLPLLSLEHTENMVLINMPTLIAYSTTKLYENPETELLQIANNFEYYLNTLLNTQTKENKEKMIENLKNRTIAVMDNDRVEKDKKFDYTNPTNHLSRFYYRVQFTDSLSLDANANANPHQIKFGVGDLTTHLGGTLAHEYAHSVSKEILDGKSVFGFRGADIEVITSRIDNSWGNYTGLGFDIYEEPVRYTDGLYHTSGRFKDPKDLQNYFSGYIGLVYSINQGVAEVILDLPVKEQVGYIRQWNEETNMIRTLTETELQTLNMKTVEDLVDNNIGIFEKSRADGPLLASYGRNDYIFDSHYFITDTETINTPHRFPFQLQMFDELMANKEYEGWEAVQLYFSDNKGANTDLEGLQLVFKDKNLTFKQYRKNQLRSYSKEAKEKGLKNHTFDELKAEISEHLSNIREFKISMYQEYMATTNEFRESILDEEQLLWGTSPWNFNEKDGTLTVRSGQIGPVSEAPWNRKDDKKVDPSKIKQLVFKGSPVAGEDSRELFSQLTQIEKLDLSGLDTSRVKDMTDMFSGLTTLSSLVLGEKFRFKMEAGLPAPSVSEGKGSGKWGLKDGVSKAYTPVEFMKNYGTGDLTAGEYVDASLVEKPTWGTANYYFRNATGVLEIYDGELGGTNDAPWNRTDDSNVAKAEIKKLVFKGKAVAPADSNSLFWGLSNLTEIEGLDLVDTSNVKNMKSMFSGLGKLKQIDLSHFKTSNVTNMGSMFYNGGFERLDLTSFDTSKVTNMSSMFSSNTLLKEVSVASFDTSKVTTMSGMFKNTKLLSRLDLTSFDTAKVTTMDSMFVGSQLTSLTLGEAFRFKGNAALSNPTVLEGEAVGKWRRKDGQSKAYTSEEFMANYGTGDLSAGEYVDAKNVVLPKPTVNPVTDQDEVLSGSGKAEAVITAKVGDKEIGTGKVNAEGAYEIKIAKQAAGTKISVTQTFEEETSETTEVTVSHKEVKQTHIFQKGYWESYGLVLNGQTKMEGMDMSKKDSVTKTLELVDEAGTVIASVPTVNTNWYTSGQYDGYQAILSEKILGAVSGGDYRLQVRVTDQAANTEVVSFLVNEVATFGIQDYQDKFLSIPKNNVGIRTVEPMSKGGQGGLRVNVPDAPLMGLISEGLTKEGGRYVNGYVLNTTFDFAKAHKKHVVIEDKSGNVVKELKDIHTWDLTSWNIGIAGLQMKSGFQVIIPLEYQNTSLYRYKLQVTTENSGESPELEVALDKIM